MSKSLKANGINVTNSLATSGSLNFSDGYVFMDNSYDTNSGLPSNFQFGTSKTQGNTVRDNFNLNNNGPIQFGNTSDDSQRVINRYPLVIKDFPISATYPWLYPITTNWSQDTQTILDSSSPEVPVTKCLGKGIGSVDIYKTGSLSIGNQNGAGSSTKDVNGKTITTKNQSNYQDGLLYPYNGYIYSGTLVELISQTNPENGKKETVVVPYQTGRGIPTYYNNFQPDSIEQISETLPWGPLVWPDSGDPIEPFISPGIEPNRQAPIYGVVMDSYSSQDYNSRPFKSRIPENITDTREPWYNHPAPQTIPPTSYKGRIGSELQTTQGFLSPGPNESSIFWSPWPKQYCYKSGDPIPVLTQGVTTVRIGAAYNIASTTYGISKYVSATDRNWIPVGIIPLFQGERLEAGSLVYGSVKGINQTVGPDVIDSQGNESVNLTTTLTTGVVGQNIWDLNIDTTWGNIGWCGTPGLSFRNIPDTDVPVIETLGGEAIPYLNQCNQGSVIVQAVTSVSPYPGLGNKYDVKLPAEEVTPYNDVELYEIYKKRFELEGISGRASLSQMVPEKAQPIGVLLETIVGTTKWPYDGLPLNPPIIPVLNLTTGGVSYTTIPDSNVPTRVQNGFGGSGLTVTWVNFIPEYPNFGTIVGSPSIIDNGSGYSFGQLVTIKDESLPYFDNPQYKGNNATYSFITDELIPVTGGFGYYNSSSETINISKNNLYTSFIVEPDGTITNGNILISTTYPFSEDTYNIDYNLRVISYGNKYHESSIFVYRKDIFGNSILNNIYPGKNYIPNINSEYFETDIITYNNRGPLIDYESNSLGTINNLPYLDYGVGNNKNDILLAINGPFFGIDLNCGENATMGYGEKPLGYQEICSYAPWYKFGEHNTIQLNGTTPLTLVVNTVADSFRLSDSNELMPCFTYPTDATEGNITSDIIIYKLQYNDTPPGGATGVASPMYFGNSVCVVTVNENLLPLVGGSNYIISQNVKTYNMSANTLRVPLEVVNGVITTNSLTFVALSDSNYSFNFSRYIADVTNGTKFRIMFDNLSEDRQYVFMITNFNPDTEEITIEKVSDGEIYDLPDGIWYFQTQRLDNTPPEVSIFPTVIGTAIVNPQNALGQIRKLSLDTPGVGNETNDILIVLQENSDNNAFFLYNNNMDYINLPPFASKRGFLVDDTDAGWDRYNNVMNSATNLLDKEILVEIRPNQGQYMENILPSAQQFGLFMPSSENPYKPFY